MFSMRELHYNRNRGTYFEVVRPHLFHSRMKLNMPAMEDSISSIYDRTGKDKFSKIASLLRAVSYIDLTTLCSDDAECNVQRLCHKAQNPIDKYLLDSFDIVKPDFLEVPREFLVGAVCVYPARVKNCAMALKNMQSKVPIAAVAAGFPSAQYHFETKLEEIKCCVRDGAKEIDIVISRQIVLEDDYETLYEEVKTMKEACGNRVLLKTIIAAGELGSLENIYRTSLVCMAAGSDFIKTSTGKESVNATIPIGITMARAIRTYKDLTGFEVGFKAAGGIRTSKDALLWQSFVMRELGKKWLHPRLFRIGASGLLNDIEKDLFACVNRSNPSKHIFTY